jgi:hypothetical protein
MNPELFHAVLAMDAYNRGYNAGVEANARRQRLRNRPVISFTLLL